MTPRISLALALHNHQPVGNFGWVFAEVYEHAYLPMLEALERHPGVRLSLHYTGPLLEWLRAERPDFIRRLGALADRGQVEILGGGYFEPVLASLPERDRVGQLTRMADEIEASFGRRPTGAWLAERVWEPDVPTSLATAGYRWTILDDAHFRAAAIPEEALWGPYTTDDQGHLVTVFGTEQGLRYHIPFRDVDEVIAHLRAHATEAGERVGMMGDDGEKFGGWPTTWEHCWGRGRWVDRFFEALEANADWITTTTPSDWLAGHAPIGRVYVPTGSYAEMGEWALPPDESLVYSDLLHHAQEAELPEARWLRGAFWRNFQVKYREINDLHKQMLRVSEKVARMPAGPGREQALDHLYRGQSNDCYWHGLFGGIYIAHMRLATFEHLIAAEDLADHALGTHGVSMSADLDLDGRDEILLADDGQVVTIKPDGGGGIGSWDIRAVHHAVGAVLRRRPEAYHERLRRQESAASAAGADADGPVSIHEIVRSKEPGLAERLHYDAYERRAGLVRFLPTDASPGTVLDGGTPELGDFRDGDFSVDELDHGRVRLSRRGVVRSRGVDHEVTVRKVVRVDGTRTAPILHLEVEVEHGGPSALDVRLGVELTSMLLGGGGNPQAWWSVDGRRTAHDASGQAARVDQVAEGNDWVGLEITTGLDPAADAWWAPIETISNSESGFERVYQGSALLLSRVVSLAPGATERWHIARRAVASHDRAEETGD
jgi:hypothetical protein